MFNFKNFPASRLYTISKKIVDMAFFMGGYKMLYYEANICNYRFPDGKLCFDTRTLNPSINCPLCGGTGVVYKDPKEIIGIIIDTQDAPQRKREGIILTDTFRLVLPPRDTS